MDIYFLDLNTFSKDVLESYINSLPEKMLFSSREKTEQHFAGQYLLKYVLNNVYGIENFEIEIISGKPFLKNLPYYYSISHSKNIVGLAFSDIQVGFDIEHNKTERNFEKISKRYGQKIKTKKEFYEFWTKHEAKIKFGKVNDDLFFVTGIINDDFTYSAACKEPFCIYNFKTINM